MINRSVSIKDVASHASVAVGTVSNVLNYPERVSSRTRERVLAAISELGFVRNDAARQLRAGQSRTIGLIVLDVGNPFFTSLARAAEDAAAHLGSAVVLGNSGQDREREAHYIDLFEEQRVQGLLISPVGDITERLETLRSRGLNAVLVDRIADPERFSSVSVDDEAGGYLAARHLLDLGRRRLAFVGGPDTIRQVHDRRLGAERAVEETEGASLEIIERPGLTVLEGRAAGDDLVARGAGNLPDAVFCANDLLALGVMQSLTMLRELKIPEDVALIGYDDIDFASSAVVPLSSIRQPTGLLGRTAVQLLNEELEQPGKHRQVVFRPELIARASTLGAGTNDAGTPVSEPARNEPAERPAVATSAASTSP